MCKILGAGGRKRGVGGIPKKGPAQEHVQLATAHLLPLRFGTQLPNMMCIMMVQNLKVA
jgi:hypothetical protein